MNQNQEREIIKRVQKGERDAYALLIEAYKGPVFNLVSRMTGSYSDADDLSQEIFIRAYQNLHQFNQDKKFFTWLYTLGINLIRNHLKKNSNPIDPLTEINISSASRTQENPAAEGKLLAEERMIKLEKSLLKLPVDLREAIILKFYQDLTFEEVAAITGDSLSAVKMRIYRSLNQLKQLMDGSD